ncbi:hypothetical protein RB195_022910 [Necator americanus]|uniref:Uncharacterized protein n=1 Tax=Necator americanus TaxID=51031 RepID=A0ABR1EH24_NECAM
MTEVEVGSLFGHVEKYLSSFYTDYFMTDDTNTFWNGYNKVAACENGPNYRSSARLLQAVPHEDERDMPRRCHRNVFVAKYTSILRYLRENEGSVLASDMKNSWSDRVDQRGAWVTTDSPRVLPRHNLPSGYARGYANIPRRGHAPAVHEDAGPDICD